MKMKIKTRPHKLTKRVPKALKKLGVTGMYWDNDLSNDFTSKSKGDILRQKRWAKQRNRWGFDERETWNLDLTIAYFVYPRLKFFVEQQQGFHPGSVSSEEWNEILHKMLKSFEYIITDKLLDTKTNEEYFKIQDEITEGLILFGKYMQDLWS